MKHIKALLSKFLQQKKIQSRIKEVSISKKANQILKQLKKDNEFEILKKLRYTTIQNKKQKHKIWKSSCYPRAIISEKFLTQKIDYTDFNAVRHGIINDIEKYPHTSYHNHYCNHFVLLKIDSIEF